ncbi:hypothetical protein RP20_CCG023537 [Aedes albopictus]|nr:hypothetical protein RP20_CCG023537 [Aedes albopictus]
MAADADDAVKSLSQNLKLIYYVQGKDPSVEITQDVVEESEDERFEELSDSAPPIELPPCELSRLEDISEVIANGLTSQIRKDKLAQAIESENYIKKLLNLFHMCEDLENHEGLHYLYEIFKNIFLLNKNALFEIMFAEDTIFDVVGCLEYDPTGNPPKQHRQYLKQLAKFREAIPIRNSDLLAKIHQTYRVQYIQDIVLPTPSVFEDNMLNTLSSFIFFNKVEIVTLIQEDEKFLDDLFTLLTDPNTSDAKRRDIILFLKEFCNFAQYLQPQSKETFYKTLISLGILPALEITLAINDKKTKAASIDILTTIVEYSPSIVRDYTLQQYNNSDTDEDQTLINIAIEQMLSDSEPELGGAVQLMGVLRILLDPENMLSSVNKSEKSDFLNFFYKHSIQTLIGSFDRFAAAEHPLRKTRQRGVPHGPAARARPGVAIVLRGAPHLPHQELHHQQRPAEANTVLGALRFLRKIIALKDEFYNRRVIAHIVKSNLFAPVVDAFVRNNGRYNLLESAILELFEFIKIEDIKSLYTYFVENFGKIFDDVQYVQTFKTLKNKYDQQQDRLKEKEKGNLDSVPSILRNSNRYRRDQRQLDEEEEIWFNEEEDFAETNKAGSPELDTSLGKIFDKKSSPESSPSATSVNGPKYSSSNSSNTTTSQQQQSPLSSLQTNSTPLNNNNTDINSNSTTTSAAAAEEEESSIHHHPAQQSLLGITLVNSTTATASSIASSSSSSSDSSTTGALAEEALPVDSTAAALYSTGGTIGLVSHESPAASTSSTTSINEPLPTSTVPPVADEDPSCSVTQQQQLPQNSTDSDSGAGSSCSSTSPMPTAAAAAEAVESLDSNNLEASKRLADDVSRVSEEPTSAESEASEDVRQTSHNCVGNDAALEGASSSVNCSNGDISSSSTTIPVALDSAPDRLVDYEGDSDEEEDDDDSDSPAVKKAKVA